MKFSTFYVQFWFGVYLDTHWSYNLVPSIPGFREDFPPKSLKITFQTFLIPDQCGPQMSVSCV